MILILIETAALAFYLPLCKAAKDDDERRYK